MKLETAVERVFDRCNLMGDNCDIYSVMYRYKVIRELPEAEREEIYEEVASRLGFGEYESMGSRLRILRGDAGLNETARAMGIAPAMLSNIEHGNVLNPHEITKHRIASYYKLSIHEYKEIFGA